jgi:hypothetical protein
MISKVSSDMSIVAQRWLRVALPVTKIGPVELLSWVSTICMWGSSNMAIPMPWYMPLLSVAYDKYDAFAIGGVRGCVVLAGNHYDIGLWKPLDIVQR